MLKEVPLSLLIAIPGSILSIINAVMLIRYYFRDKPILKIRPVHPEIYQWFFELPPGEYEGEKTRKYGFLLYISIANQGIRDVSLKSWNLKIKTKLKTLRLSNRWIECKGPFNIPQPKIELGGTGNIKAFPVLGQSNVYSENQALVASGCSTSGFTYYIGEFYGHENWDVDTQENEDGDLIARSKLSAEGVYGKGDSVEIELKKITLKRAKEIVEDIDLVDKN